MIATLVSSANIKSTFLSIFKALIVISSILPIGVATTYITPFSISFLLLLLFIISSMNSESFLIL
ncbi:hypothetical protein [uncultured Brachyspira sp.]|uniref:hypothetical protein n=1 Tax=uncultured Brachyspira sp. TaxID=221953 RepID=UPI002614CDFE|nr:hypothetical protein [uncultured Brachyspira sp.]